MNSIYDFLKQEEPKNIIYHYTTQKGFLGILEKKLIWASQITCLNDSSEYKLAIEIADELIKERQNDEEKTMSGVFSLLKSIIPDVFVCSFSEMPDLLSQWRAYCRTSGFSIGFNSLELKQEAEKQGFILVKCLYDREDQKALLRSAIDDFFINHINNLPEDLINQWKDYPKLAPQIALFTHLLNFAPIIKDPGFQEEAEWRLISKNSLPIEKIFFRNGNSYIIPYYQIELRDLNKIIDEIIVGPTPHPDIAMYSTKMVLEKSSFNIKDNLKPTSIPYRNW